MEHTQGQYKQKENCRVIRQESVGNHIYSLWLHTETIAGCAQPGQFVMAYSKDKSRLLPRPISVCQTDGNALRLIYRTAGAGTREFSALKTGDFLELMGPLGNGYPLEEGEGKKVLLLGGGIGIPPLLETAAHLAGSVTAVLGYKDEIFLKEEFEKFCPVVCAVEHAQDDTADAVTGNVLDAVRKRELAADIIFACGPTPMLRAVQAYAAAERIPCWLSLEERMACGIGACLGCVCDSVHEDEHLHVCRKRVCKDGPVFPSTEVAL